MSLEPLLLRDAEALARKIQDADRAEVALALRVGRQKVEAGDQLWSNGHVAEGLQLARDAFLATKDGVAPIARALGTPPEIGAVLAARGLGKPAIERVEEASRNAELALPRRDADVSAAHAQIYDTFQLARRDLDRALDPAGRSPGSIRASRIGRIAAAIALAAVALGGIGWALRPHHGITATASAQFATGPQFAGPNAIDGRPDTAWLLPDRTTGVLDLRIAPAQRVERVLVTNASNPPWHDRASREIRIEAMAGDRVIRTVDGVFETFEDAPEPRPFDVGADGVDRIRITVLSWHRSSGGLAEVAIE